jgi:hypothetical protein
MDPVLTPYFERMYMPLLPIVFFPFMYDIFTQFFLRNVVGGILIAMVVTWRFARFVQVGMEYHERTVIAEKAIEKAWEHQGSKFILDRFDLGQWKCMEWVDWSFTMESMLRSAAVDKQKTVSIATQEDLTTDQNARLLSRHNYVMRRWEVMNDNTVNADYFVMKEGEYVQLEEVCK